jgi:RNAse (barnase) inhibitor barstar
MEELVSLFGSYLNSGIHHAAPGIDAVVLEEAAAAHGLDFIHIKLSEASDKACVLRTISEALGCPDYFGMNWDALYDCLTDMSWRPSPGYVLHFAGLKLQYRDSQSTGETLMRVLDAAAGYWRGKEVTFYIMLSE